MDTDHQMAVTIPADAPRPQAAITRPKDSELSAVPPAETTATKDTSVTSEPESEEDTDDDDSDHQVITVGKNHFAAKHENYLERQEFAREQNGHYKDLGPAYLAPPPVPHSLGGECGVKFGDDRLGVGFYLRLTPIAKRISNAKVDEELLALVKASVKKNKK